MFLDGEDVTSEIRSIEVTRSTRHAADSPSVRRTLIRWQRGFAEAEGNVITEGRDQGTIVFPDAFRKFYLTASNEERARRRHAEHQARGESIAREDVLHEILERDKQDASREIAPMRPAEDALIIDSTGLDLDEVVNSIQRDILDSAGQTR